LSAALTADLEVRPDDSRYELRKHMRASFAAFGFEPASKRKDGTGIWSSPPEGLKYDRVRFDCLRSDEDEVFRFIWDNREKLDLCDNAHTQVLNVRPSIRIGIDGFVVHETVAQYYQVARFTREELIENKVKAPRAFLSSLAAEERSRAAAAGAADDDGDGAVDEHPVAAEPGEGRELTTPIYGGGILIFDEFGRVKYWIHNDVLGKAQKARLAYLWDQDLLQPDRTPTRVRAARLSNLHRLRALAADTSDRSDRW
jgi:hypothetical protein